MPSAWGPSYYNYYNHQLVMSKLLFQTCLHGSTIVVEVTLLWQCICYSSPVPASCFEQKVQHVWLLDAEWWANTITISTIQKL